MAARTRSLRLLDPPPNALPGPIDIDLDQESSAASSMHDGARKTEHPDGSVTVDLNPGSGRASSEDKTNFYKNLADDIDESELARIASELLQGVDSDERSRQEWLDTRARGITLLGLKLDEPRGDVGTSSAPLEGMSQVRHPLLLEATLRFQANARSELLPAAGPVKVRNDKQTKPAITPPPAPPPMPPPPPGMGHNGGPPMGAPQGLAQPPAPAPNAPPPPGPPSAMGASPPASAAPPMAGPPPGPMPAPPPAPALPPPPPDPTAFSNNSEELAQALEKDFNHYLTTVATEYYPDTDRMLFWVGAGGQGIKKVYNCPLRQRPVSESVDAEDIIVSNAATNLENCGRITHRIKMRPSTLKRMQMIDAYRDITINDPPPNPPQDPVKQKKNEVQGIQPGSSMLPKDADHEILEIYCELNISGFEHKRNGKETGLRCPYKVTIEKHSQQVLEVRRNWRKEDKLCMPKQFFVDFPFVRAMGFYGIGLIHIAGNTTTTLTAAWREMLDAGMFASFPGFLYAKGVGRQLTNQFRVPPGGGIGLDIGIGRLQDSVMPLPYKEPGPAFTSFIQHVEEVGQRVAGTAEIQVGEGTQEVPVGTTMAMIEQSTKVMDAVHKRLHAAQAQEFQLLKERFREDPEAFWRHNKNPTLPWRKQQFIEALDDNNLSPVADPNNPTSLHRIAKATAIKVLQQSNPTIYNPEAVDRRIMRIVGIDPEGLFQQQQQPPDPRALAVQQKAASDQVKNQIAQLDLQIKAATQQQTFQDKAADRASREKIEQMKIQLEGLRVQEEQIIHAHDAQREDMSAARDAQATHVKTAADITASHAQAQHDIEMEGLKRQHELQLENLKRAHEMAMEHATHSQKMDHAQQLHEHKLQSGKELSDAKVEATKAIAKAKPKPKPAGEKK